MSAATPGDVARLPRRFFDPVRTTGIPTLPQRRAQARDDAIVKADRLARVIRRLNAVDESDLDLNLESYRRAAWDLDGALDVFDAALADEAGPRQPAPTRRDL